MIPKHVVLAGPSGLTAGLLMLAGTAQAVPLIDTVGQLQMGGAYNGVNPGRYGGEFTMTIASANAGGSAYPFQTFCLEYNEHIYLSNTYKYTVNYDGGVSSAQNGGGALGGAQAFVGGGGSYGSGTTRDPISVGTAFLYSLFAQGALPSDDEIIANGASAALATYVSGSDQGWLQEAIWWLEGEPSPYLGTLQGSANPYVQYAMAYLGVSSSDVRNDADSLAELRGVRVLNLETTVGNVLRQDVLWWSPPDSPDEPPPRVPDAGSTALLLAGAATLLLGVSRRVAGVKTR